MQTREEQLICVACGTQFNVTFEHGLDACRICDDPRQFVPPDGQAWTSLARLRGSHHRNKRKQDDIEPGMWSIVTEPKVGIGQRCVLLQTPAGNILWDCITFLDHETYDFIQATGGLKAIVISHPHYYSTHLDWARSFDCPVYIAAEDEEWVSRPDTEGRRRLIRGSAESIIEGVTAIKTGGHFPGSLVLHWKKELLVADSLVTVPSALYHVNRPPGTTSYAFMWSIPNMIPLPPSELIKMWRALQPFDFESTHGAFMGQEVRDVRVKERVLESMKIQARGEGWGDVEILKETL